MSGPIVSPVVAGRVLTVAGLVTGLIGGFLTALWEIFASPLYAGSVPLPVSPVLAVVTSLGLIWYTRLVTGSAGLAMLPGVVWLVTMLVAAAQTSEGDTLIPSNDYMGLAAILLGMAAWAIVGYRLLLDRARVGGLGGRAARTPAKSAPAKSKSAPVKSTPAGAPPANSTPAAAPPAKSATTGSAPKAAAGRPTRAKAGPAKRTSGSAKSRRGRR